MTESAPISRILVVDDHADTTRLLARFLRTEGFDATEALGFRDAMERSRGGTYDLLLTDLSLGDGTGAELLANIRMTGAIRSVLLSGWPIEDHDAHTNRAGFDAILTKPAIPAQLAAIIRGLLALPVAG